MKTIIVARGRGLASDISKSMIGIMVDNEANKHRRIKL